MTKNKKVLDFISSTIKSFKFLESEYNYAIEANGIKDENYFPDTEAFVRYVSLNIEIEIFWYFTAAVIGVTFSKKEKKDFSKKNNKNFAIVNLYALAKYSSNGKDEMFLLNDCTTSTFSSIKQREKTINNNINEVIENLAEGVKKYGLDIVAGDISVFKEVIKYQKNLLK